jgi:hypothetical protein
MNNLPDSRRAIWGRTHGRTWNPADFDPVQGYAGRPGAMFRLVRAAFVLSLFALLGVLLAFRG